MFMHVHDIFLTLWCRESVYVGRTIVSGVVIKATKLPENHMHVTAETTRMTEMDFLEPAHPAVSWVVEQLLDGEDVFVEGRVES